MATHDPRPPYTAAELASLYPAGLQLQQVQVVLRHGERTPVSPRFQNAGLSVHWPYCSIARWMGSLALRDDGDERPGKGWDAAGKENSVEWDVLRWRRRLETLGKDDTPVLARGPGREADNICFPGQTTDTGRLTTHALGSRLRHLYVHQLAFLPARLTSTADLYLRASPIPRALDAVQEALGGLYPAAHRAPECAEPTFHLRAAHEENLFDNDHNCPRYAVLYKAFADRAAARWNATPGMDHVNAKIGKWMPAGPDGRPARVAIDSHPRLSGVMDTINSTAAHGPATRLPAEFYDARLLREVDRMVVDEWFSGYLESREFRRLGKGAMAGDVAGRMMAVALGSDGGGASAGAGGGHTLKLALTGAHDTTLAGFLTSLGAFGDRHWPPFTSHLAVELFRAAGPATPASPGPAAAAATQSVLPTSRGWWSSLFSPSPARAEAEGAQTLTHPSSRTPWASLSQAQRSQTEGYYVRIRYNDEPVVVPACRAPGRHLEARGAGLSEEEAASFCTLEAFKRVCDAFTPRDWRAECRDVQGARARYVVGEVPAEPSGYLDEE